MDVQALLQMLGGERDGAMLRLTLARAYAATATSRSRH